MSKNNEINRIKKIIIPILKKNNVVQAGIFGSYARGEQKKISDLDLLIAVKKGIKFSLLDLVGLEMELKKSIRKKVDLLTYNGINPYLKERILKEEIKII
jgi:predicted nucleotidyltransferase